MVQTINILNVKLGEKNPVNDIYLAASLVLGMLMLIERCRNSTITTVTKTAFIFTCYLTDIKITSEGMSSSNAVCFWKLRHANTVGIIF